MGSTVSGLPFVMVGTPEALAGKAGLTALPDANAGIVGATASASRPRWSQAAPQPGDCLLRAAPSALGSGAPSSSAAAGVAAVVGLSALSAWRRRDCRGRRNGRNTGVHLRASTFGPVSYETKQKEDAIRDEVSNRVAFMVLENEKGMRVQLDQYGYCVVDGFLGGTANKYPDTIRDEMKALWNRGWFAEEAESDRNFKVGPWRLSNNDTDHRFVAKLQGAPPGDEKEQYVETQYEVAPTLVNFTRSLLVSLSGPMGKAAKSPISSSIGVCELIALCGNGARYDRRVSNVYGWNTQTGFAPDPRKLTVFYYANPNYREELGGHLQLEGVITPTGAISIEPFHDRLVMFWSDKTVWSMRPSQATTISEHQMALHVDLMAEDSKSIEYDPKVFARWFPELRGKDMDWPPVVTPALPEAS